MKTSNFRGAPLQVRKNLIILSINNLPGLAALSHELANYGKRVDEELERISEYSRGFHIATAIEADRLQNAIRQIFPSSAGTTDVELRTLNEQYMNYKKSYVNHLRFDPHLKNLSKY